LELKNIEHRVNLEAEALGLPRGFPQLGPEVVLGIELSSYAAELARVSVWIGEIQWMRRNGFEAAKNPILRTLNTIENRDAVLAPDGRRAEWPKASVVIGNPPFIGAQKLIRELGEEQAKRIRKAWSDTVPASCDFVALWFAKAHDQIISGQTERAGFVATNSISELANRPVLARISSGGSIFEAWSDEPWVVDGADVRVSLVCFSGTVGQSGLLDGKPVKKILADLSANELNFDLTTSVPLLENDSYCVRGIETGGPFEFGRDTFEQIIAEPINPNGRHNSEVVVPIISADSLTGRLEDEFVLDFNCLASEEDVALFEAPYAFLKKRYESYGSTAKRKVIIREKWWLHRRSGASLRTALENRKRYLVTPRVAKFRFFSWSFAPTLPDSRLFAFATSQDFDFGVLSSFVHEAWTLGTCSWHGVGNDPTYNAQSCLEAFPFPEGLTPNIPAADYATDPRSVKIAVAAKRLNELRENWLNPADLVIRVPEVVPGYPDRILPKDDAAAKELKKRTLTNLYNARPAWLDHAHKALDEAVAEAYGWGDDWRDGKLIEDEILSRLFQLNQQRAKAEAKAATKAKANPKAKKPSAKGAKNVK
jgi:type II restriction/modification system DNA methylase subunit YeeA